MPIAPFVPLTKGVRDNLGVIRRGVAEGISSNELERVIRSSGGSIGRQALQRAYRAILAQTDYAAVLNRTPRNLLPDPASIPTAITRQLRVFSFTFRITGVNTFTQEEVTRDVTVSTSTLQSRQVMEDRAKDMVQSQSAIRITGVMATGGSRAGEVGSIFDNPVFN